MPLEKGKSKKVIQANIGREIAAGKEPDQAAAIAYSEARRSGKKSKHRPGAKEGMVKK